MDDSDLALFPETAITIREDCDQPVFIWILTLGFSVSAYRTKEGAREKLGRYLTELEFPEFCERQFVESDAAYLRTMDRLGPFHPHISIQRSRLTQ